MAFRQVETARERADPPSAAALMERAPELGLTPAKGAKAAAPLRKL
jgi:hypothetical protein